MLKAQIVTPSQDIIKQLCEDIFIKIISSNNSIFLIGAAHNNKSVSLRDKLRKQLELKSGSLQDRHALFDYLFSGHSHYDIYYPEFLFDELLQGPHKFDLLELENLLADSVQAVVIILESAGAIAELGAFANHHDFSNKLIVVVNKKYQKDKSFIQLGPVKLIKTKHKNRVIYFDYAKGSISDLATQVDKGIRSIEKTGKTSFSKRKTNLSSATRNPIDLQFLILLVLFIYGPLSKEEVDSTIEVANRISQASSPVPNKQEIIKIRATSIKIMLKNRDLFLSENNYQISKTGTSKLFKAVNAHFQKAQIKRKLDDLRINVLTIRRNGIIRANKRGAGKTT